jgi:hypothetical protein
MYCGERLVAVHKEAKLFRMPDIQSDIEHAVSLGFEDFISLPF